MTVVAQPPVGVEPYVRPSLRYRIIRALIILTVLAVLGGGIGTLVYVNHYQPLGDGGSHGGAGNLSIVTDGIDERAYVATGPTGSITELLMSIRNSGHFAVRLLGTESIFGRDVKTTVEWLPNLNDRYRGLDAASPYWTGGPMTLPAGQTIGLKVSYVRPSCPARGGYAALNAIPIRWSALGVHHTYLAKVGGDSFESMPFYLCYPRSALAHIEH